jgi:hypothetical protein
MYFLDFKFLPIFIKTLLKLVVVFLRDSKSLFLALNKGLTAWEFKA